MKNIIFSCILYLLIFTCSSTYFVKADDNETDVWLTEGGEERSLTSRPLPPMAMKMNQGGEDIEDMGEDLDTETEKKCKPDKQPTHPEAQRGTALGKCHIPDSIWSKTCRAVMAVNEHYKSVESKVDPDEVTEAVRKQLTPTRNPECSEKPDDEGTVMRECRSCTVQLKPNAFGVQLTCYDCQQGKSDKTCHYIIKDNPKFIVSATFFEMEGFEIPEMDSNLDEVSGAGNSTKEKKSEKQNEKLIEKPIEYPDE